MEKKEETLNLYRHVDRFSARAFNFKVFSESAGEGIDAIKCC